MQHVCVGGKITISLATHCWWAWSVHLWKVLRRELRLCPRLQIFFKIFASTHIRRQRWHRLVERDGEDGVRRNRLATSLITYDIGPPVAAVGPAEARCCMLWGVALLRALWMLITCWSPVQDRVLCSWISEETRVYQCWENQQPPCYYYHTAGIVIIATLPTDVLVSAPLMSSNQHLPGLLHHLCLSAPPSPFIQLVFSPITCKCRVCLNTPNKTEL